MQYFFQATESRFASACLDLRPQASKSVQHTSSASTKVMVSMTKPMKSKSWSPKTTIDNLTHSFIRTFPRPLKITFVAPTEEEAEEMNNGKFFEVAEEKKKDGEAKENEDVMNEKEMVEECDL